MKNQDFHTKIEETLNSLESIRRAEANPFLLTRVLEQMRCGAVELVKPSLIWQAALSFVLVIGINISIGMYSAKANSQTLGPAESGYFSNHQYNY